MYDTLLPDDSVPNEPMTNLAASLLSAPESPARATSIASAVVWLIPDSACIVHRIMFDRPGSPWIAIGKAGDISVRQVSQASPADSPTSALSRVANPYLHSIGDST